MAIYKIICRTDLEEPAEGADVKISIDGNGAWRGDTDAEGAFLREEDIETTWNAVQFDNENWVLIQPQNHTVPMPAPGVHVFHVQPA